MRKGYYGYDDQDDDYFHWRLPEPEAPKVENPPAKYAEGNELTVYSCYSKREVLVIGKAKTIRYVEGRGYLYRLVGCTNTPEGWFLAWENELHPTTPEDKAQLEAQS